jgi:hypothetical protein
MPNWCSNTLDVSHADPEMMKRFAQGVKDGTLFKELCPPPAKMDASDYWGTKWDVNEGYFQLEEGGASGDGFFQTAWSPPIKAYEKLAEIGFQIDATFHEAGNCYAGVWSNEEGEDSYEYDFENKDWRDGIDNGDVLEILEEEYRFWLEENEAEEGEEDLENKEGKK